MLRVDLNVIVSARANDVRTVQQIGGLMFIPFGTIYLVSELNFLSLDQINLLIISAMLVVVDIILFFISEATFRREEILTRWW